MKRAAGTCNEPGCAGVPIYRGRCQQHAQWNPLAPRQRGRALMQRRARLIRRRGPRCERCGAPPPLELHHLDANAANDDPENLRLLCLACHLEATLAALTPTPAHYRKRNP
jgi:hypothetical protein